MTIRPEEPTRAAGTVEPGQDWRAGREQRDRARRAAAERLQRQRRKSLVEACHGLGDGTPAEIRREAAAVLHGLGWTLADIGEVLGTSSPAVARSLPGYLPAPYAEDPVRALRNLARRAELARRELAEARARTGTGPSGGSLGQEDTDVLQALGFSADEITAAAGLPRGAARETPGPGGFPVGLPPAAALVHLVREHGPGALDSYDPAIGLRVSMRVAAAWVGITPAGIPGRLSRLRTDGSPQWPAPGPDGRWTLRELVLHRATGPNPGPPSGNVSPGRQELMDRILAVLARRPEPPSTSQLRSLLGLTVADQPALENALRHLAGQGLVTKIRQQDGPRRAYWQLPRAPARARTRA